MINIFILFHLYLLEQQGVESSDEQAAPPDPLHDWPEDTGDLVKVFRSRDEADRDGQRQRSMDGCESQHEDCVEIEDGTEQPGEDQPGDQGQVGQGQDQAEKQDQEEHQSVFLSQPLISVD